ncbi:unnamed protein product [Calypogeia fissa]
MAASCVSVALNTTGVFNGGVVRDNGVTAGRQMGRVALASPSVSVSSLALLAAAGFAGATFGSAKSERNAAIAARAADLEQGLEIDAEDSEPPPPPPPPALGTKLYVGNLPWSVHSKQLAEVFQDVGNVELVEVIYDRDTQRSRGFAFVTMTTVEDAERAIEMLDKTELEGRIIKVNFPLQRDGPRMREPREYGSRPPRREGGFGGNYGSENKLFVGNLSWSVDDVSLDSLFQEYGKVLEAKVVYDRDTGRSKGFGFVTLSSSAEVNLAISKLDGTEFDKRMLRVNLAGDKPPPREDRDD